uniref:Torsin family 2 member A n=1 Tax=Lepisosteus oculatus TaxID=7918 RepID=W5M4G1_LEPOC
MELLERMTAVFVVLLSHSPISFPAAYQLNNIYCKIYNSCDCDFQPDIQGLEWDLYRNLYGQHLAQEVVSEAVADFLAKDRPDRPLVLSFHGSSGTGKTMVSSMLGKHLYGTTMGSPYIHQFIPTFHFPSAEQVQHYKDLKSWIQTEQCWGGVLAGVSWLVVGIEHSCTPGCFRECVIRYLKNKIYYCFLAIEGHRYLGQCNRRLLQDGKMMKLRQKLLRSLQSLHSRRAVGFYHSKIIPEKLITRFVPFLPLSRLHVERCARRELCQRGMCHRRDVIRAVSGAVPYFPAAEQIFSQTGCKTVPPKINLFL